MSDGNGGITRRSFGILGAAGFLGVLSACNDEQGENGVFASAARSSDRTYFKDVFGWVARTDDGQRGLTLAFAPNPVDMATRHKVAINNGVFPVITDQGPILEVHMGLDIAPNVRLVDDTVRLTNDIVQYLQLTFWNFDEPTPVIRVGKEDIGAGGIDIVGLDGHFRRGGWVVGTARGVRPYKAPERRDEAYSWNVEFQTSLE